MDIINKDQGFSLIEMVIALLIVIIISSFISISTYQDSSINWSNQIRQISNNLRYAQSLAMSLNTRHRVYFTANSYRIAAYNQINGTETFIYFPISGATTINLFNNILFAIPPTPDCFAFNGKGQPCNCTDGGVFSNDITIKLITNGAFKSITVTAYTGYIN